MWWSIVVQIRGESIQTAMADRDRWLCAYDGAIYSDRQAKKMAKGVGYAYNRTGQPGQPRLIESPMEPRGAEEVAELEKAIAKGMVPPH